MFEAKARIEATAMDEAAASDHSELHEPCVATVVGSVNAGSEQQRARGSENVFIGI
jgi:hypothetical protein